jgi:hypothetical protein
MNEQASWGKGRMVSRAETAQSMGHQLADAGEYRSHSAAGRGQAAKAEGGVLVYMKIAYRHPDIFDGPSKRICYLPGRDWTATQAHNLAMLSTAIMGQLFWVEP